ncbi:MAG: hypothetical protein AAGF15_01305 [Pseudomonadota bacterium]
MASENQTDNDLPFGTHAADETKAEDSERAGTDFFGWITVIFYAHIMVIVAIAIAIFAVVAAAFRTFGWDPLPLITNQLPALRRYLNQLIMFLTEQEQPLPYPFSPFPDGVDEATPLE